MTILDDPDAWEQWFQQEISPVVDPAYDELCQAVTARLESLQPEEEAQEGVARDRWEVFGKFARKSAPSARRKLLADGACEDADLGARVLSLPDLARFRVVGTLKRDVRCCRDKLISSDSRTFLERYAIGEFKDFVRDKRLRTPLKGHRALQLVVEVPSAGVVARVEVQMMTALQHAWDRRNHALYEWLRAKTEDDSHELLDLRVDDHAVAESLHAIDALADHNFSTFLRLRTGA